VNKFVVIGWEIKGNESIQKELKRKLAYLRNVFHFKEKPKNQTNSYEVSTEEWGLTIWKPLKNAKTISVYKFLGKLISDFQKKQRSWRVWNELLKEWEPKATKMLCF
jgi:hypothetical protein